MVSSHLRERIEWRFSCQPSCGPVILNSRAATGIHKMDVQTGHGTSPQGYKQDKAATGINNMDVQTGHGTSPQGYKQG